MNEIHTPPLFFRSIDIAASAFLEILHVPLSQVGSIGDSIAIPFFPPPVIADICNMSLQNLINSHRLLRIDGPIIVVGDLHGNFHDLIRIFVMNGLPPQKKYLFLGDYVDRGQYSTETIILLLTLKCIFPNYIYLLRGNHELFGVSNKSAFYQEIENNYYNDAPLIFQKFTEVFSYLPLGAIINNLIFAVHGGISPFLERVDSINDIAFPLVIPDKKSEIKDKKSEIALDLLWSDPSDITMYYQDSTRGIGCVFGRLAIENFLKKNKLKYIIRSHQFVEEGIKAFGEFCFTIFSSTSYYPNINNTGVFLEISTDSELKPAFYEKITFPERGNACFYNTEFPNMHYLNINLNLNLNLVTKFQKNGPVSVSESAPCFNHSLKRYTCNTPKMRTRKPLANQKNRLFKPVITNNSNTIV